ncbi:hypothetical protein [Rugosimonospora africana]|uniref:Uncharacterized protein n=1 Tax=Rugosimonospora africana TaxID=556532 RepID=A0A8J3VVL7_9ACTN|nr:hypothetical protein [Rugosimonospora africana]GIH20425.1 hypothetical protein Raf01_85970 [Rugosimonospora africana]
MDESPRAEGVSRRKALLAGAGLVAAGAAVGAGGLAAVQHAEEHSEQAVANPTNPIMVQLLDAGNGSLAVFTAQRRVIVHDQDFAAKIVRAAATAA